MHLHLFKRLLAASGAAGLLTGLGVATPVFATSPFSATIDLACAVPGNTQKITVNAAADALIHIEVTIGGSTANAGTEHGTGLTGATGTFTDQWTLAAVSTTTTARVQVWALSGGGVAEGSNTFEIHPAGGPCPSPSSSYISGSFIDVQQVGGQVKKTCDTGVSGNAVFSATIQVKVSYSSSLSTTIAVPVNLTLACNGASKDLPTLPLTSVITLHEVTLPAGAAAAADTKITVAASPAAATIHNTKAVVVVLPPTGQPASTPMVPWPAIALIGLLAAGAGLVLRRRI